VASVVAANRPPEVHTAWLVRGSTNLANLGERPVRVLVASAFLVEADPVVWVVLGAVGLGAVGWVLGFWRTTALVTASHLIGTLVSEGGLAELIRRGDRPVSDRYLVDVGPSYVVVCALVAGLVYGRWPGRVPAGLGVAVLVPYLFEGLFRFDVAAVGHVCAVVVGVLGGWLLTRPRPEGGRR
jgi:hypothetical protein